MLGGMKTDARKLAPVTQEQMRRQAVAAVEKGMTRVKAATALLDLTLPGARRRR